MFTLYTTEDKLTELCLDGEEWFNIIRNQPTIYVCNESDNDEWDVTNATLMALHRSGTSIEVDNELLEEIKEDIVEFIVSFYEAKGSFDEYMTEKLESNSKEAKVYREENEALIKKYDLDIFGRYTCTFNELEKSEDGQTESSYTTEVTRVMEIKKDSTAIFDDGTKGWWMLKETEGGIVHMGLVLPEEKNPQIFLVCKDKLIDETKACFLGEVPDKNRFNASFSAGNFTLEFSADGSIDGEYTEIIKENGTEYPRTEAYSGSYERDGDYLNIVLNGADAKYLIFETENEKSEIQVKGFASRYYQRIGKDK
jgi:hypothetical protein